MASTAETNEDQPPIGAIGNEIVFLLGRPPLEEFINFVRNQTVGGQLADERTLADEWRAANDHIHELEAQEAGWADGAPIKDLPPDLEPLSAEVLAHPVTQRSFSLLPVNIRMVELDRLVVFQKYINLRYVGELRDQIGTEPTEEDLFHFCLPLNPTLPQVQMAPVQNGFVFKSPSMDFRFLEAAPVDPGQLMGFAPRGWASALIAVTVGYGANFLQVINVDNRLVLGNGSHRAFMLREMGFTNVPALVQTVSREEELPVVGIAELQQDRDAYLKTPRPPMLKDYFDEQLRRVFRVPRNAVQVRLLIIPETMIAPE